MRGLRMDQHAGDPVSALDSFVGQWSVDATFPDAPPGRATFEWMPGGRFLVERWEFSSPGSGADVVDFSGIAIIGFDPDRQTYLQHYFDSRGVARVYQMSFTDGVWKLWRDSADFSALEFSQRFTGTFSNDDQTIDGR
jgi:hypothetical protein